MEAQQWKALCSERLHRQWPRVLPEQRDEVAAQLWQSEQWRQMEPAQAVEAWLRQGVLAPDPQQRAKQAD